jgi:hypothetical protein
LVEDQDSIEDPPLVTDVGLAATDTVTVELPEPAVDAASVAPPPQAVTARANTGKSSNDFTRNIGILIP